MHVLYGYGFGYLIICNSVSRSSVTCLVIRKSFYSNIYSPPLCSQLNRYIVLRSFSKIYIYLFLSLPCFLKIILDSMFPSWLPICDWPFCTLPMEQQFNFKTLKFQSLKIESLKFESLKFESLKFESLNFESLKFESLIFLNLF